MGKVSVEAAAGPLTSSVLIPSFGRPEKLLSCLGSLAKQTVMPGEVLVVWQDDDTATRDAVAGVSASLPYAVRLLHLQERNIVKAENLALNEAGGEIICLIDDDAIAPLDWLEKHLAFYRDAAVGGVGGPADNMRSDGTRGPSRFHRPQGAVTKLGRVIGNMYDHPAEWRSLPAAEVEHLVGYNMSLRRCAFDRFEEGLRRYWQMFELDACLQAASNGYRIMFDYGNGVEHWPTNPVFGEGRDGDLVAKVYNVSFNHGFIMAKHSPGWLLGPRLLFMIFVGTTNAPGVLASIRAMRLYGSPGMEAKVLGRSLTSKVRGFAAGLRQRRARGRVGVRVVNR